MNEQTIEPLRVLVPVAVLAFLLALGLIVLLRPWLARYAMAQPNSRSSHREPTPQGGGIAVVVATLLVAWGAVAVWPAVVQNQGAEFVAVSAATALLAVVGARDDLRSLPATVRLAMQCVAVGTVIADSRANCKWCRRCLGGSNAQVFFSVGCGSSTSSISWTASIG